MSSGAQFHLLDNACDLEFARDEKDWRRMWTAPASHTRLWRLISYATGFLALFFTFTWLFYPGLSAPAPAPAPAPALPAHAPPSPTASRNSIKIMVVGDSISQGYEGDYTWRYRLWQWLREADHEDVAFVGPYVGTFPPPDRPRPTVWRPAEEKPALETRDWGGYNMDVDLAWLQGGDNAHFAHWGRQAAQYQGIIEEAVREAQPDFVLLALGFNDLAWFRWPDDLLNEVANLITKCRTAKADIKFAVSNVVQRAATTDKPDLPVMTRMYNQLLEEIVPKWRTFESPVELVRTRESYECDPWSCPASHDGLHPNAKGEYQITRAFVRTLNEKYGLGSSNFSIPEIPARPCVPPLNLHGVAMRNATAPQNQTIHLDWESSYGAFGYYVQAQRKGGQWAIFPYWTQMSSFNHTNLGLAEDWELRVRADCGDQQPNSEWSYVISVST